MMARLVVDMSRPTFLYLGLVGVLIALTFIAGRLPQVGGASLLHPAHQRQFALSLVCASVLFGVHGASRLADRARAPWRVPQSQILILFLGFFVLGLMGLALSF
jgi:hypothetical protein